MSLSSSECCTMDTADLLEANYLCTECTISIEAEGEDLLLDLARDNYNYMRYGDE